MDDVLHHVEAEAAQSWSFYAEGRVRAMYYIADMSGAVFMWEAESESDVHAAIDELPMKQAGVLDFEVIPLKPYTGIGALFREKYQAEPQG